MHKDLFDQVIIYYSVFSGTIKSGFEVIILCTLTLIYHSFLLNFLIKKYYAHFRTMSNTL